VLELLNKCWNEGKVPERWGKTILIPLFKGKGGKCENYRGIALIDHITKLYERILEKGVRRKIEPQLGEEQYGYRKDRSTTDLIFTLRMIFEKTLEYKEKAHFAFIDLKKAFDSVPRRKLWRSRQIVYGIYNMLPCLTGVKQGSILSPILFIAYLNIVIREVKNTTNLDGDILAYVDDIVC
jgi:hypothetical protein